MAPAWVAGIYKRECGKGRGEGEMKKKNEEVLVETLCVRRSVGSRRTDIVWKKRRSLRMDDGLGDTCAELELLLARW